MSLMRALYEDSGVQRGFCAMCDHPITHPIGKRKVCRRPECARAYRVEYGARRRSFERVSTVVEQQIARLQRTVGRLERSLST
jgi:hypothetical protein